MRSILHRLFLMLLVASLLAGCTNMNVDETGDPDPEPGPTEETIIEDSPVISEPEIEPALTNQPDQIDDASGEAEWLVMLYLDADDETLEQDIFTDLNEAERVGSTDKVQIVAQIDRYDGGFDGDGDWTDTRRYALTQDPDLKSLQSPLVEELGEVNMASGDALVDFVTWAVEKYPAKKYALILSDHGMGWPGGFFDPDPGGNGDDDIALAEDYGDGIWLMELDAALGQIRQETGIDKFELIGFDACLMGLVEVYQTLAPHARYAVASQEVEPGLGWAYASFLIELAFTPEMDGWTLAESIVKTYIDKDELITDDDARQELVEESSSKTPTAAQVAEEMSYDVTLAAVDLDQIGNVVAGLDDFVYAIASEDQNMVAEARSYAQSFENTFDEDLPSPYIDLSSFVSLILENDIYEETQQAGLALQAEIEQAVLTEKHGEGRDGATGLSIYFPVYDLYELSENMGYTTVAAAFAEQSQWDEYLDYHFTNTSPADGNWDSVSLWDAGEDDFTDGSRRPGSRPVVIDSITLSGDTASPDQPVTLDTVITGEQIAYIYVFAGRVSEDQDVLLIEDIDYLDAEQVKQVGGVFYPDWGASPVEISYDFEPIVYAISDGENLIPALLMPDDYGEQSASYMVEGTYQFANGSPSRYAQLIFRDGSLERVIGYTGTEGGAPHEITPASGDQFTILDQGTYLADDAEGDYSVPGGTLVFGDQPFTWEEIPAQPGTYVVGIMVEDFDGNVYTQFEVIEVTE